LAKKLRVAIIFGGRSGEHEVSLRSAASIIRAMDRQKYEIIPIAITREGRWLTSAKATKLLPQEVIGEVTEPVVLLGDPTQQALMHFDGDMHLKETRKVDVVFPVLHGPYGEDGTIQGLLELADVAYVGCGVLASAVGMDKEVMKRLFQEAGLPIVRYLAFTRAVWESNQEKILRRVLKEIGLPAFVKPANLGSSVGITKVKRKDQLKEAIDLAAEYDRKILVEEAITGREIEVSVVGNDQPIASLPGEIIPGAEFYDYDDKYISDTAQLIIPAQLPKRHVTQIQQYAIRAFQAIDGAGMARVDFFIERETNRIIVNEINTIPGFTSISMYPKLWEASGLSYSELVDRLIQLAIERHQEKSRSRTSR
jgi:D-alanine-D-alanine ligase